MTEISTLVEFRMNLTSLYRPECNGTCLTEHSLGPAESSGQPHQQYGFIEVVLLVYVLNTFVIPVVLPCLLLLLSRKLWHIYIDCTKDFSCSLPLPPGNYGLPIVGETLTFLLKGKAFFDERRKNHGMVYKTHMLGRPTIRVVGAKRVRQILTGENTKVTSQWPSSTRMLLGEGSLSSSTGTTHSIRKKAIVRAFTNNALNSYTPVIQSVISSYIRDWSRRGNVLGYREFRSLTFELSCRVLLGIEMDKTEMGRLMCHFETFMSNLFSLPICVPGTGLYKGMAARKVLRDKIEECITLKQKMGSAHHFSDALSLMMDIEGQEKLTLDEVKDVGLELLFAGHETTSSAACTLVIQLAKNPNVLFNILRELAEYGLLDNIDMDIPLERLNKLKYTRNVVMEVLRIAPPIGAGYRKALCTMEIDGYQIPKGWTIAYAIRDTHETAEGVDSPEVFNPDRWSHMQSNEDRQHFLSFGGGKKGCAGKEFALLVLRLLTVELARSCSWDVLNKNPVMKYLPVPHPVDNLPMIFTEMPEFRRRASTV